MITKSYSKINSAFSLVDPGDLSQKDPRWVGAWWLGFVICAGCSVAWAFPMLLFPAKIPVKDEDPVAAKHRQMEEGQSVLDKAKGKGCLRDNYNE